MKKFWEASWRVTQMVILAVAILFAASKAAAQNMSLDDYLSTVMKKNHSFQATEAEQSAADFRYQQGDLELSPILTLQGSYLDDKSEQILGDAELTHNQVRQYAVGLAKKFSTGTQASVQAGVVADDMEGMAGATPLGFATHTGTLAFGLTQSLWKDFFGHATRLRWDREAAQEQLEKNSLDLQTQQTLITAEAAYWDLLYLQQERNIRQDSLERAKKIETWVRRRSENGIGDRADVLNAQSLVASRELQLLSTLDNLTNAQKIFADQLEMPRDEKLPSLSADLGQERDVQRYLHQAQSNGSAKGQRVVRLDTYLTALDAQVKAVAAQEAVDRVRPDLLLQGQYKTNGYDTTDASAIHKMTDKDHPTSYVGVTFSWPLDWTSKNAVRDTAKQDALAARLKKERSLLESETAWLELNRRHSELSKQIQSASTLSQVQVNRANAYRDKLSKGRAITSDVILAEQDAADAQLNLARMKAEQRKLESQGRLFVKVEDNL